MGKENKGGNKLSLNYIKEGEYCCVERLEVLGSMRRRFLDLGIVTGTRIECLGKSPFGGLSAYLIRGAVIAIREKDCESIIIKIPNQSEGI